MSQMAMALQELHDLARKAKDRLFKLTVDYTKCVITKPYSFLVILSI